MSLRAQVAIWMFGLLILVVGGMTGIATHWLTEAHWEEDGEFIAANIAASRWAMFLLAGVVLIVGGALTAWTTGRVTRTVGRTMDLLKAKQADLEQEATDHECTQQQLRRANEELESRVTARTAELTRINSNMESEIAALAHAREEIRRSDDTQKVMGELLRLSLGSASVERILGSALDLILGVDWLAFMSIGAVFLVDDDSEALVMKANRGLPVAVLSACATVPFGRCLCGRAALSQEVEFADGIDERHETTYDGIGPHGHYCVPIVFAGKTLGVVNTYVPAGHVRDASEEDFLVSTAGILAGIIVRRRAETTLADTNRHLEVALADLKDTQAQVVQQERLSALGQMASGVAHDFNNALSPIVGLIELLQEPGVLDDKDRALRYLEVVGESAQDAASVVHRLREFYRERESGEIFRPTDLNAVVARAISRTQPRWQDQAQAEGVTIRVCSELGTIPQVAGNESELLDVLVNVIFNAVDAISAKTQINDSEAITVRTFWRDRHVVVEVHDTGTGMPDDVRRHCLEPFFSTKGERGTGLGLAMAHGIIERHVGTVEFQSRQGEGTTFRLRLPMVAGPGEGPQIEGRPQAVDAVPGLRVLLVEDDPGPRETVKAMLTAQGHAVETAENGRDGLAKFHLGRFDLVVTDMAMPELSGEKLAAAVKRTAPDTPVILVTGFGDMMKATGEHPPGVDAVLAKPVTRATLREAIAKVTAG